MEFKFPANQAEMDQIRKSLVQEISDDDLDAVSGGNDDLKGKTTLNWTCPGCGAVVVCKSVQDAAKHVTKDCPGNPYK